MYKRDIFTVLEEHLQEKQITVITGMRRTGKTTALKYLLQQIKSANKIYLDLEKVENRHLFNQSSFNEIEISLQIEGIDFNERAFIALDEIQLVPEITSVIKYLYDTFDIKFLVSGSSSFYIKNRFSESLAGRKQIFEIYPLTFREYLHFKSIDIWLPENRFTAFNETLFQKLHTFYLDYINYGGLPEVALLKNEKFRSDYIKDIINSYIELDVKLLSDFSKSNELYKLIKVLSVRTGNKLDYTKLSGLVGISRNKIKDYISLLNYTYFVFLVNPFTHNPDREISVQPKLYLADSGIANILGCSNEGSLFETCIFNQLKHLGKINYYAKKNGQEIDFVLNSKTAVEVKRTPTQGDFKTLNKRAFGINIPECHIVGLYSSPGFRGFVWGGTL